MSNKAICFDCTEVMVKKHANLEFKHPVIGIYTVINVVHYACEKCGSKIIPPSEAKRIEEQGTTEHLIKYLNENGKQPYQTVKAQMLCEEDVLEKVLNKLKNMKFLEVEEVGELKILELKPINHEAPKLTFWDKLKNLFI